MESGDVMRSASHQVESGLAVEETTEYEVEVRTEVESKPMSRVDFLSSSHLDVECSRRLPRGLDAGFGLLGTEGL